MLSALSEWLTIFLAFVFSLAISFLMTPPVKNFAERVGAIDVPKDERRIHNHPIPRMGGLAIFIGFMCSLLIFVPMTKEVSGLLIGALIIAVMGAVDDIVSLRPVFKLLAQVAAALVAIRSGISFSYISSINIFSHETAVAIGYLSVPFTMLWIVGCTNAVNLIDGLDGLACGVSAISSLTMLVVSLFVAEPVVSIILAALTGACLGFIPFNLNPAKIFMGDVGSQFLGYVLATTSIMGMFKFHAIIAFLVPVFALALPLSDTVFAFFRRILHGQSPFHADKGHFHHRLLAMGMSQKQAVAVLYSVSALFGLFAVLLVGDSVILRVSCIVLAFIICITAWYVVLRKFAPHGEPEDGAVRTDVKENKE